MRRATLFLSIGLSTLLASAIRAQQARPRPTRADSTTRVGFKERSPLLLSSRALLVRRGAYQDVVLVNPTDRARTAVLRLRWSGPDTTARAAPVLFETGLVDTIRVPARGEAVARLWANRSASPNEGAAMREGVLVLTDSAYLIERQMVLDPSNARGDSLLSPISTMSFRVVRRCPFPRCSWSSGNGEHELTLPVFSQWDSSAIRGAGLSLAGVLQGPRGHTAIVEPENTLETLGDGLSGLRLRAKGLTRPGEYTGTLPLSAAGGTVQLKISVADWWVWAALAILLGILLGYKLQRYTGVERAYWQLKARLARVATKWRTAHEAFTTKLVPLGTDAKRVRYSMADSVEQERTARGRELDALAAQAFVPLDENNQKFTAVITAIDELEKQIAKWPALGVALAGLHKAMADAKPIFATLGPPARLGTRPIAIEGVADAAFTGGAIEMTALASTSQNVRTTTGLLVSWMVSCQNLQECYAWHAEAKAHGAPATKLDPIRENLVGVHLDLWTATSDAELEGRKTRETLNTAQKALLALLETLGPPGTFKKSAGVSGAPPRIVIADLGGYMPPLEKEASWFERRVWTHDLAMGALILAVAWASGFKLLYSDTFGTVPDYLTAVLWGFGSKTGVEALTTTLAKFFGR